MKKCNYINYICTFLYITFIMLPEYNKLYNKYNYLRKIIKL